MVDPRTAHMIDGRTLLGLLPHVDQSDLQTLRQEFARALSNPRMRSVPTWQEAWNVWSGATPGRPGQIAYTPLRCKSCHGRGFNPRTISRNLARTGQPTVCGDCRGMRRGQRTTQVARHADVPVAPPRDSDPA